jgi:hypothetical protein
MRNLLLFLLLIPFVSSSQVTGAAQVVEKTVISYNDTLKLNFLLDSSIYKQGWSELPQTKFWQQVINLTSDTCLVNIPTERTLINKVCRAEWSSLTEDEKKNCKDSIICNYNLDRSTTLYVTSGKGEFYEMKKVLPDISRAIEVFERNGVDPWYAQTILLIESPGKTKAKSSVGANGPFQLMKSVARKYGLVVNNKRDDRSNLEKAGRVAARLLNTACIPNIKKYLNELNLSYNETDLWFRLLVLHAYHAGAGNVHCALNKLQPKTGGVELFKQLWQTECGGFKNESQNYSQIALASLLNFDDLIQRDGDTVFLVQGDKLFRSYKRSALRPSDAFNYLNTCLFAYETDLVDGTLPYDIFMKHVSRIRKEFKAIAAHITGNSKDILINTYPAPEEQMLSLANRLIKKQRYDEAISVIKLNIEAKPSSVNSYDMLAKAYSQSGNKQLASVYSNRSIALREKLDSKNKD